MEIPTPADFERARERIAGALKRTPLHSASQLGRMSGTELLLKLELFQKTGSFKPRGCLNRIAQWTTEEKARGIVTVSAGNHAQAAAWAASREGIACTVVMPASAPLSKRQAAAGYGAEIVLHDDMLTIFERTAEIQQTTGSTFLHPYDDPFVVAGAGTVGFEILEDAPAAGTIVVPVGGGGLLSGIAAAVRSIPGKDSSRIRIIGVEPVGAPTLTRAIEAGAPVRLSSIKTIADGLSAPFAGTLNLEIARTMVDEVVLVSDDEIRVAMRMLAARCKVLAEPAGAAAVAAVLAGRLRPQPGPVVAVVSGGNVDLDRLAEILAG